MAPKKTIEETYQKKSLLEHVLHRPGMYIGDIEKVTREHWIFENGKMIKKNITFSPGLYKIFDEIITNALDHSQRDPTLKNINVTINENTICIFNDGEGIPVEIHKEHNKYVPEIIFGEFHTSSNYDDSEARTVGGLNGYGSKLTNAYSKLFTVEICDSVNSFKKTWENNMSVVGTPEIKKSKKKSFTKITFLPDYARFGSTELEKDTFDLFRTRVYEGSAVTGKSVTLTFNDEKVETKCFEDFVNLYIGTKLECPRVYEKLNERWEMVIALNPFDKFTQVSFVNGISTSDGGTHVDYIINQMVNKFKSQLEAKYKEITIRPAYIKDNILIFLNCLIENPTFSSQTKEQHTTKASKFGSTALIGDDLLKKIDRLGITANVIDIAKAKDQKSLSKTDGKKQFRISGIPKLDDAGKAGGAEGWKCKLILTEGDSAKASAISGLSEVGRDYYGVFPLRGKLLNVRDATAAQLLKNQEINDLKKILGLQQGKEYTNTKNLRYGGIMIYTDADNDGSHIKGLIINFVHTFWPSLIKIDSFISSIITPIVKAQKGKEIISFYNQSEFVSWKETINPKTWNIKYYKGLATSTAKESKEYFKNLSKQVINYSADQSTDQDLIKAFKKGFEDNRKEWIKENTGKNNVLDFTKLKQTISQFVNNELVNFSIADLQRSIPNMIDGFKPSQRKVLYGCLKKKLTSDIKVAQLSGYISEHTSYHHGEVSLQGTIINMAQDYTGSNNINLLTPSGQFGTRILGGHDAGSPRYIFTKLEPITKILFNEHDSELLEYLDDDGQQIEPKYFVPIIPMVLVNGSEGIGTGYSTSIPCYNPDDIIANLKKLIDTDGKGDLEPMVPWYRGFKGTIVADKENKFTSTGVIKRINTTTLEITELPIGKWTDPYKAFLDALVNENEIIDFKPYGDDTTVNFKVIMQKSVLDQMSTEDLIKKFKLTSSISTSNMHVFDEECKIRKMSCPEEIIYRFYNVRKKLYQTRKKYLLDSLTANFELMDAKVKFIKLVVSEQIIIFNKKKEYIVSEIKKNGIKEIDSSYDYLLNLKIHTLTQEKIQELESKMENLKTELETLRGTTISQMWTTELLSLEF
jgi:DNA topoisomerase II